MMGEITYDLHISSAHYHSRLFCVAKRTGKVKQNDPVFRSVGTGSLLAMGVFGILALIQCFTQVPAGHVGVVDFFGIVPERTLPSGINLVNPLARGKMGCRSFWIRNRRETYERHFDLPGVSGYVLEF
jgi:hypothetical protein